MALSLINVMKKGWQFVEEGCLSAIQDGPLTKEMYRLSPCPVTSSLALMSLMTQKKVYQNQIRTGLQYLEGCRNKDGGWGRTPLSESDEKSTEICITAIKCWQAGVTPAAIQKVSSNMSSTWLRDVPRLLLGWPPDSPLLKIIESFLTSETAGNIITDFSFENLPIALRLLPPSARPLILALSCIHETTKKGKSRFFISALKKLILYQSPHGAWCEDILITSLCILCLSITGRYPQAYSRGIKWLASVQYHSGAWPSFNQLTNWDTGLAAMVAGECFPESTGFIKECADYLSIRANQDGSFGTLSPYSFPDLDDSAVALLGLSAASRRENAYTGIINQIIQLILSLQNHDGSWGTFPEITDLPPYCSCYLPAHITSADVTIHVLQSLLKTGVDFKMAQIQKSLWWLAFQQRWDGSWKSTWYIGNAYATSQAMELFADCNLWPKARQRARNWLIMAQNDNGSWPIGSAGETGLAIAALLKNGEPPNSPCIDKGLSFIASRQKKDGSFVPAYGGLYAGGLYYEDPITEALAALRAIHLYLSVTKEADL